MLTMMRNRLLAVLLVLLSAPLLVLGDAGVAAAATRGPSTPVTISGDGTWRPYDGWECELIASWQVQDGGTVGVIGNASCSQDFNGDLDGLYVTYEGSDNDGDVCEAVNIFGSVDGDASSDLPDLGTIPEAFGSAVTDGTPVECRFSDMCWQAFDGGDSSSMDEGCEAMDLGAMVEPEQSCTGMTGVSKPVVSSLVMGSQPYTNTPYSDGGNTWAYAQILTDNVTSASIGYYMYAITDTPNPGTATPHRMTSTGPTLAGTLWTNVRQVGPSTNPVNRYATFSVAGPASPPGTKPNHLGGNIIGIGYVAYPTDGSSSTREQRTYTLPQNFAGGLLGTSDPAHCSFYWGTKIASVTGSEIDEPLGPVALPGTQDPPEVPDTPDAPDESGCDFSITDPSTWASAGVCALVGLFTKMIDLLGTIKDVLWSVVGKLDELVSAIADIAGAILDGLLGLFVPSDGFWEDKLEGVKDAWDDTGPITFINGISDVADAVVFEGGTSCEGPEWNFNSPIDGAAVSLSPMSSCGEYVSIVAGVVRTALTALVWIGGFLASARVVGSAFGVNLSFGKSGGDE